jgi:predicted nucleic acid-binding protein
MTDLVVSDTSVLIHLARIRRLDLLRALYQRVLIPPAVRREAVGE